VATACVVYIVAPTGREARVGDQRLANFADGRRFTNYAQLNGADDLIELISGRYYYYYYFYFYCKNVANLPFFSVCKTGTKNKIAARGISIT
jgi:hypothetical protein